MKKRLLFLAVLILLVLSACEEEEYVLCSDNVTKVLDLANCPREIPLCPSCDDNNNCTLDKCNALTDYKCEYEEITPCDGNGVCETGEFPWSGDCPESCDDSDECTTDSYNYVSGVCFHEDIVPCCGNEECDGGETYVNCPFDCEQLLEIKVTNYEKRTFMADAAIENLMRTDYIYLIVKFKIHNIGIDKLEEVNYRKENGFYYDPFKMHLEDGTGKLYDVEYDSDLLKNWVDKTILPKGNTIGAALLFIVPISTKNVRLITYDKYGSRLDISEIY